MKITKQPDGLEGYVVLVEENDMKKPLDLPELKGPWVDIINDCEGVVRKDGLFHCVYLTNNEFAIEFLIPDETWLSGEIRKRITEHLIRREKNMKKTYEARILKKGTCLSLSGRSELTYEFGHNETIMFRITENTGAGHFCAAWISLDAILDLLNKAKEPFSLTVFKSLYPGRSINNTGFLGAALKQEGLIVCEKRQYIRKDSKAFLADLNKLVTKKSPARKTAAKEGPK